MSEIKIRSVQNGDAADIHAIVSDPKVTRNLKLLPSIEFNETVEWLNNSQPTPTTHHIVAESNNEVVGSGILEQNIRPRLTHSGHLQLMVSSDFWGRGIGTLLLGSLLNLADNWLNLGRIESSILGQNQTAKHLSKKFGFSTEGTKRCATFRNGHWLDEISIARLRAENFSSRPAQKIDLPKRAPQPDFNIKNVKIRPPNLDDLNQLFELFSNPINCRTTLQMPSQNIAVTENRLKNITPGIHRFVAELNNKIVGQANLHQSQKPRLNHSGGIGMTVHPDYWGLGIGSLLMESIIDLADNWLNLKRIELDVNIDNPAAIQLYKKYGFVIEGTKRYHAYGDGRWTDSHFMARIQD